MSVERASGRISVLERQISALPVGSAGADDETSSSPPAVLGRYASQRLLLLTGNAHRALARDVASSLGVELCKARVETFKNGETSVELFESVRDCDCFVVQPTCNPRPNDYLMELLLLLDALRRAGAARVTAVVPFYGYARQDRMDRLRVPISAKLVTDCIYQSGAARILTLDLHASQIQGMGTLPFDNVYGLPLIAGHLLDSLGANAIRSTQGADVAIVSPDAGGAKRAELLAKELGASIALFSKRRERANEVAGMDLVGTVRGKLCILIDDMVDTAGTLCLAAEQLREHGAARIVAAATHGIFSDPAIERITASPIEQLAVLDTIPMADQARACSKIHVIPAASLLAGSIHTLHFGGQISHLYKGTKGWEQRLRTEASS